MTIEDFKKSLDLNSTPIDDTYLKALWLDGKGDWTSAHDLVDHLTGIKAAKLHAYLHRKEGDQWNARYWYNQAGVNMPKLTIEEEWEVLVKYFIAEK